MMGILGVAGILGGVVALFLATRKAQQQAAVTLIVLGFVTVGLGQAA